MNTGSRKKKRKKRIRNRKSHNHFGADIIIMGGTKRSNIKQGLNVKIVLKKDQRSGKLTEGVVKDILTKSPSHTHGIKVRLTTGDIGRVKEIESENTNGQ